MLSCSRDKSNADLAMWLNLQILSDEIINEYQIMLSCSRDNDELAMWLNL